MIFLFTNFYLKMSRQLINKEIWRSLSELNENIETKKNKSYEMKTAIPVSLFSLLFFVYTKSIHIIIQLNNRVRLDIFLISNIINVTLSNADEKLIYHRKKDCTKTLLWSEKFKIIKPLLNELVNMITQDNKELDEIFNGSIDSSIKTFVKNIERKIDAFDRHFNEWTQQDFDIPTVLYELPYRITKNYVSDTISGVLTKVGDIYPNITLYFNESQNIKNRLVSQLDQVINEELKLNMYGVNILISEDFCFTKEKFTLNIHIKLSFVNSEEYYEKWGYLKRELNWIKNNQSKLTTFAKKLNVDFTTVDDLRCAINALTNDDFIVV